MVQKLLLVTAAIITLSACDTPQSVCEEAANDPENRQPIAVIGRKEFIDSCIKSVESYIRYKELKK